MFGASFRHVFFGIFGARQNPEVRLFIFEILEYEINIYQKHEIGFLQFSGYRINIFSNNLEYEMNIYQKAQNVTS